MRLLNTTQETYGANPTFLETFDDGSQVLVDSSFHEISGTPTLPVPMQTGKIIPPALGVDTSPVMFLGPPASPPFITASAGSAVSSIDETTLQVSTISSGLVPPNLSGSGGVMGGGLMTSNDPLGTAVPNGSTAVATGTATSASGASVAGTPNSKSFVTTLEEDAVDVVAHPSKHLAAIAIILLFGWWFFFKRKRR